MGRLLLSYCACAQVVLCVCVYTGLAQCPIVRREHAGPLLVAESCDDVLRGTIEVIKQRLEAGEYSDRLSLMTLNANPDGM